MLRISIVDHAGTLHSFAIPNSEGIPVAPLDKPFEVMWKGDDGEIRVRCSEEEWSDQH